VQATERRPLPLPPAGHRGVGQGPLVLAVDLRGQDAIAAHVAVQVAGLHRLVAIVDLQGIAAWVAVDDDGDKSRPRPDGGEVDSLARAFTVGAVVAVHATLAAALGASGRPVLVAIAE